MRSFIVVVCAMSILSRTVAVSLFSPLKRVASMRGEVRWGVRWNMPLRSFATSRRDNAGPISCRPKVALTRESSNNFALHDLIAKSNLKCDTVLLPVLQHSSKLNGNALQGFLDAISVADIVVVTSPQAAFCFSNIWSQIDSHEKGRLKFASIGKKTSSILAENGICTKFSPSVETAASLALELPKSLGMNILYPASEIALNIIPHELQKRGFKVTRMSAYETNEAQWGEDLKKLAKKVDIVTLTSPSAARAWVAKTGSDYDAIVIGPTTFKAAKSLGFNSVTCVPNKTGCLQGMVESIKELLLLKY